MRGEYQWGAAHSRVSGGGHLRHRCSDCGGVDVPGSERRRGVRQKCRLARHSERKVVFEVCRHMLSSPSVAVVAVARRGSTTRTKEREQEKEEDVSTLRQGPCSFLLFEARGDEMSDDAHCVERLPLGALLHFFRRGLPTLR